MNAAPHLVLQVRADVNAQLTMRADQDLVEERDVPIHDFLIHILYVCIHMVW